MYRLTRERPDDRWEVEQLLDLAFAPGRSALSSYQLREGVQPITALNTVARDEYDNVMGAVRYWPVVIGQSAMPCLLLGPIAVHPTTQGEGLGKLLIRNTLDVARSLTWERVILIGDAAYYERVGFFAKHTRKLTYPKPYNPERFLGHEIVPGAFQNCSGLVRRWAVTSE